MDIERAVDDFVHKGKDLFRLLRSDGEALSPLALGVLRTQLHILTVEAARLKSQQLIAKKTNAEQSTRRADACAHGRAIDNYIDEKGNQTKLFYCLECGTVIEPPPVATDN
jgi:hypothetical protein